MHIKKTGLDDHQRFRDRFAVYTRLPPQVCAREPQLGMKS